VKAVRLLALAAAAGGIAAAAYFLWPTTVPGDLARPDIDPASYLTAAELGEAVSYERFGYANWAISTAVLLLVLVLYARRGAALARESAAGRIGTGLLLGMLGFAIVWLAQLPFGVAQLWWDRRHDVTDVGYAEWIFGNWLGLGAQFVFICLAIAIVMALARPLRDRWWLLGGPAFVGLALLFSFTFPYLTYGLEPLDDPQLKSRAEAIAAELDLEDVPVKVEDVDEFTTSPNAYAAGYGPSRVIVLWNTLLDGRFSDDEVTTVLAHEYGHHSQGHLWENVAWYALFALPGAYLLAIATRRRGGMYEPSAVPLSLLVLTVLQLAAQPVQNVITRQLETEADWVALETTRDPDATRGLFERFSETALADPDPPGWAQFWLGSHPTMDARIEFAEAWRAREQGAP
jgi:STE24 endopeptidase